MDKLTLLSQQQQQTGNILWLKNEQHIEISSNIECYHLNTLKYGKDIFYCLVSADGNQYIVCGFQRAAVICPKLVNEITVLYANQELIVPCPLLTTTVVSLPLRD